MTKYLSSETCFPNKEIFAFNVFWQKCCFLINTECLVKFYFSALLLVTFHLFSSIAMFFWNFTIILCCKNVLMIRSFHLSVKLWSKSICLLQRLFHFYIVVYLAIWNFSIVIKVFFPMIYIPFNLYYIVTDCTFYYTDP